MYYTTPMGHMYLTELRRQLWTARETEPFFNTQQWVADCEVLYQEMATIYAKGDPCRHIGYYEATVCLRTGAAAQGPRSMRNGHSDNDKDGDGGICRD